MFAEKKHKTLNSGTISRALPDDIMVEILLNFPAKSLAQFKCVCKKWYNLIQNPNFVTFYINHSKFHSARFLAFSPWNWCKNVNPIALLLDESLSVKQYIHNPPLSDITQILGPVNGLYCCCIHWSHFDDEIASEIALWNPFTSEFRQLNHNPFRSTSLNGPYLAIGFGSTDDDIKLVCVTYTGTMFIKAVVLYSLARDSWRQTESDDCLLRCFGYGCCLDSSYLDGVVYWLTKGCTSGCQVFVFDMKIEVLREVQIPNECKLRAVGISVRNKSIVLLDVQREIDFDVLTCIDIWEMKEEGFWSKLFSSVPLVPLAIPQRFCDWNGDESIYLVDGNDKVVLYNVRLRDTTVLQIDARFVVLGYEVSIVSVKGGNGLIQVL